VCRDVLCCIQVLAIRNALESRIVAGESYICHSRTQVDPPSQATNCLQHALVELLGACALAKASELACALVEAVLQAGCRYGLQAAHLHMSFTQQYGD
jgi:hypothetical protein